MSDPIEIEESNAQLLAAWIHSSQSLPGRRVEHTDGVSVVLSGTDMVMLDAATLSSPAAAAAAYQPHVLPRFCRSSQSLSGAK
ncbi:hypothetical protein WMF38_01790 [Sorangium sp. So ce118]